MRKIIVYSLVGILVVAVILVCVFVHQAETEWQAYLATQAEWQSRPYVPPSLEPSIEDAEEFLPRDEYQQITWNCTLINESNDEFTAHCELEYLLFSHNGDNFIFHEGVVYAAVEKEQICTGYGERYIVIWRIPTSYSYPCGSFFQTGERTGDQAGFLRVVDDVSGGSVVDIPLRWVYDYYFERR